MPHVVLDCQFQQKDALFDVRRAALQRRLKVGVLKITDQVPEMQMQTSVLVESLAIEKCKKTKAFFLHCHRRKRV